jgi:biopolymer transport protein ExbD
MKRRGLVDFSDLEEPIINLTPLIDVVFVVLISFILIAPMLEIDNVQLASGIGQEKGGAALESSPLTLVVRSDNTIWVQGKVCNLVELEKLLLMQKKQFPGQVPQVIHDKNASFGTYQNVKNLLERCGFKQMDLVLKPG